MLVMGISFDYYALRHVSFKYRLGYGDWPLERVKNRPLYSGIVKLAKTGAFEAPSVSRTPILGSSPSAAAIGFLTVTVLSLL